MAIFATMLIRQARARGPGHAGVRARRGLGACRVLRARLRHGRHRLRHGPDRAAQRDRVRALRRVAARDVRRLSAFISYGWIASVLTVLIGLHVLGALWHGLVRRDGMRRMGWGGRRVE
jgi:hypothetical protein